MDIRNGPARSSSWSGGGEPSASPSTIRVGIAELPPYSAPLLSSPESFFHLHVRHLLEEIDPRATLVFETAAESAWAAELAAAQPRIELAAGIRDLDERRAAGLEFLDIPGTAHGLSWRLGRAGWGMRLETIQRQVLFGRSVLRTAHRYADLLLASYLAPRDTRPEETLGGRAGWSPIVGFDLGGESFRDQLCRRFCAVALSGLTARLAAGSRVGPPEENDRRVLEAVRRDGRRLIPQPWQVNLEEALRTITEGPGQAEATGARAEVDRLIHCLSCSAYLADGIHGGNSDRYCRDCADESGNLRPRAEVADSLARWILHFQPGLSAERSRESAERYMAAMPAWSGK